MPHTKQTKKRVKTSEIRRQRNAAQSTRMRHAVRDLRAHAATGEGDVKQELDQVSRMLDRLAGKGLIHKNKAARLKSRLAAQADK